MNGNKGYKYIPDKVSAPGETLKELLEERGMLQTELAERIGRPLKTVNEIIKGKASITHETAIQLERALGVPSSFWNQNEAKSRGYIASQKEIRRLREHGDWLLDFPIQDMQTRGLIPNDKDDVTPLIIFLLNFFGVATPEQWNEGWTRQRLAFRKAVDIKENAFATKVWLRQGEIEGSKILCRPFSKESLLASFSDIHALTHMTNPTIFLSQLKEICSKCGVAIACIKPFTGIPVYGASYWMQPNKALLIFSLSEQTADAFWFTVYHELCHILKHSKKEFYVRMEGDTDHPHRSAQEQSANKFAMESLVSSSILNPWMVKNPNPTADTILKFAKDAHIAPGILVSRLQSLNHIQSSAFNNMKIKCLW